MVRVCCCLAMLESTLYVDLRPWGVRGGLTLNMVLDAQNG